MFIERNSFMITDLSKKPTLLKVDRLAELSLVLERLEKVSQAQLAELQTLRSLIGGPPTKTTPAATSQLQTVVKNSPESNVTKKRKRKLWQPLVVTAALVLLSFFVIRHMVALRPITEDGKVAGATMETVQVAHHPDYKESQADVPFDKTEWETLTDTDFGISMTYPKNATNIERVIGGSNIWLLRKQGYLMKFSIIDLAGQTTDDWWQGTKDGYADKLVTKGTFKSLPAYIIKTPTTTAVSGTTYLVQRSGSITEIWVKDEPATTDDGLRLVKMVASLQVTQ